jgi:predicted transcriptional regulator
MLLSLSTEQCDNLRSQLLKKQQLEESLSTKVLELEHAKQQLSRELEEKNSFIAFLEDERQLFREMADDLRSGLVSLDGTIGTSIIKQVREKVIEKGLKSSTKFNISSCIHNPVTLIRVR